MHRRFPVTTNEGPVEPALRKRTPEERHRELLRLALQAAEAGNAARAALILSLAMDDDGR